jgi:hypothetical protein
MVAGKQPTPSWLGIDDAVLHCTRGLGIWDWASSDDDGQPDVVMACVGDVPTLEILAAVDLLRTHLPNLKVRVVNVVDLMRLQNDTEHPHGLSDRDFDTIFTADRPVIFAYHGYPWLIPRLTYKRTNHRNIHVRGYKAFPYEWNGNFIGRTDVRQWGVAGVILRSSTSHRLPAPVAVEEVGFDRFDLGRAEVGAHVGGETQILMDHGGDPPAQREPRAGAGPGGGGPGSSRGGNLRSPPPPGR